MIPRQAEIIVRQRLAHTPAVVLLGPRQVGKTTLARQIAQDWPTGSIYLDLERPADRNKMQEADAYLRAQGNKLIILDEIHRLPGIFEILTNAVEQGNEADNFCYLALPHSISCSNPAKRSLGA